MSIALGFAIAFGSFLVGLFIGVICKSCGVDAAVERMQEKCKRCIVIGEITKE